MTQSIEAINSLPGGESGDAVARQDSDDELKEAIAVLPADPTGIEWAWRMIGVEERDRQLLAIASAPEGAAIASLGAYLRERDTHIYFTVHSDGCESTHSRFIYDDHHYGLSRSVVTAFGKIAYYNASIGAVYENTPFFRGD